MNELEIGSGRDWSLPEICFIPSGSFMSQKSDQ